MSERTHKRRGAPLGNQNARKHNFYASALGPDPRHHFVVASRLDGIDDEISLMRVQIKAMVDQHPQNPEAITRAVACLGHLHRLQNNTGKDDHKKVRRAIAGLIEDLGIPPGLIGDTFKNRASTQS